MPKQLDLLIRKCAGRIKAGSAPAILLAFALAVSGCTAPAVTPSVQGTRIQGVLLRMAEEQPQTPVQVIVQQRLRGNAAAQRVVELGGQVVQDLRLINAFAAVLPASAIPLLAQDPSVRWVSLDAPMQPAQMDTAPRPAFVAWATANGSRIANTFVAPWNLTDSALGPVGTYAISSRGAGSFTGFAAEITQGYRIAKVEAVLAGYTAMPLTKNTKITLFVDTNKVANVDVPGAAFSSRVGPLSAGPVYVDVTGKRQWSWADFDRTVELVVDQAGLDPQDTVFLDAVGLRVWIEPGSDGTGGVLPVEETTNTMPDPKRQVNVYNNVIGVEALWQANKLLQGNRVGVAVVDSGIERTGDLAHLKIVDVNFNPGYHDSKDRYGHGTFVAGVIAGSGRSSNGIHVGVAPKARLINVRVSDDTGKATASDVVAGLQWVYDNMARYNIRVVNLSLNSSVADSYLTDPLCAAVEMLWLRGIVVVVSAGNNGTATLYPPANDPFVITVGATEDLGTALKDDDKVAGFSGYGVTELGGRKPDLVAPGRDIIAYLPNNGLLRMPGEHPRHRVTYNYFRMSGTSVSAPMVTGAVALLLQDEPLLTPNQVKHRLLTTANSRWPGYDPQRAGAGYVDVYAAVQGTSTESANRGLPVSRLLWDSMALTAWSSVNWNSVNWNSVNWNSVNWNSVNWNSVNWNSVNWNSVNWNSVNWNSDYWDNSVSAAGASDAGAAIPAVERLFQLLAEDAANDGAANTLLYLPSINR